MRVFARAKPRRRTSRFNQAGRTAEPVTDRARYNRMMSNASVVAVVLAGGDPADRLAVDAGVAAKALVPLGSEPLGSYVLRALRNSPAVSKIVYVGPTNSSLNGLYDVQVPSGQRMVDSLAIGLGAALSQCDNGYVLMLGADVPWVTGDMITRFVANASNTKAADLPGATGHTHGADIGEGRAQLVYPIVTEAAAKDQFPEQKRTYARLKDGKFTGGNLVLMHTEVVPKLLPQIDRVFRARKNPFALAGIFGLDVLFRLVLGTADIASLERRVGSILGAPVRALITTDAALAADVDSPGQLPGTLTPNLPPLPNAGGTQ